MNQCNIILNFPSSKEYFVVFKRLFTYRSMIFFYWYGASVAAGKTAFDYKHALIPLKFISPRSKQYFVPA